jgi:hypothetical protein
VNILKKMSWMADNGWPTSIGIEKGVNNISMYNTKEERRWLSLGCRAMYFGRSLPTFQRTLLHPHHPGPDGGHRKNHLRTHHHENPKSCLRKSSQTAQQK